MDFNIPTTTILYSIEKTIKAYRKLSQYKISQVVSDITVNQALILLLLENSDKTQTKIADLVFKDYASLTRIVKLMIKKAFLVKITDSQDKRKAKLEITEKGKVIIQKLKPIIQRNREIALNSISSEEIEQLYKTLKKLTKNCNS
ncbi:MarR family winged helix-turn-helix transcriptional regulator [Tenacibaculum sp.]|uniref:MarR family winged helix-turn-helix transcriptional regulator n=1 Tax=Tenacibaculum sp. TaxID=1906242 RepID=UPI003AA812D5